MTEEESTILKTLTNEIRSGEIKTWIHFEMKGTVYGLDVNVDVFNHIVSCMGILEVYELVKRSLKNGIECDRFINDRIVGCMIELDGQSFHHWFGDTDPRHPAEISVIELLSSFDIRHPEFLVRYFLNSQWMSKKGYVKLMRFTLDRALLRGSKSENFKNAAEELKKKYDSIIYTSMMCN